MRKHVQLTHETHRECSEKFPLVFLLDNIADPVNVGSIFRLADSLGASRLYLSGSTPCPPHRHIKKSSRSTDSTVPWLYFSDSSSAMECLRGENYQIVAVELTTLSKEVSVASLYSRFPLCLIAGSEKSGVSQYCLDQSDEVVHIRMRGKNSSMNVASALAISAYEAIRQYQEHQQKQAHL